MGDFSARIQFLSRTQREIRVGPRAPGKITSLVISKSCFSEPIFREPNSEMSIFLVDFDFKKVGGEQLTDFQ
jgi:hypothetical protein